MSKYPNNFLTEHLFYFLFWRPAGYSTFLYLLVLRMPVLRKTACNVCLNIISITLQPAIWWKLYSNMIDMFILDWSRQQFNIITFPKDMRFQINNNQSYFSLPNDTIMRVCLIQPFTLALVDELINSLIHSVIPIQLIHLLIHHRLTDVK